MCTTTATPGTPQLSTIPSITSCDDDDDNGDDDDDDVENFQVTLQWQPPNNTGGLNVEIKHYLVNVTGPPGFSCPLDQCNITTTNTTITGLKCNTRYIVTVRAVNCIGEGDAVSVNIVPPGECDKQQKLLLILSLTKQWIHDYNTIVTCYAVQLCSVFCCSIVSCHSNYFSNVMRHNFSLSKEEYIAARDKCNFHDYTTTY